MNTEIMGADGLTESQTAWVFGVLLTGETHPDYQAARKIAEMYVFNFKRHSDDRFNVRCERLLNS